MRLFLVTNGNTSVDFVMGLEKWIVPIVTRSATTSDGERRNSLAAEEGDYVEASERYSCALEIRLGFIWPFSNCFCLLYNSQLCPNNLELFFCCWKLNICIESSPQT